MTGAARKRRATISDVAEKAGVSRGTVSRVLNGGTSVSPATLLAVQKAMADTDYRVNPHARSLKSGRARSIAFVLTESTQLLFEDPNFAILVRGAAQALSDRNYSLVLMIAGTKAERQRTVDYLSAGHVDGVLLVSTHAGDNLAKQLLAVALPVVACGRPLGLEGQIGWVAADDTLGGQRITEYLLSTGRQRVGTITGPMDTSGGVDRLAGYRQAMGDRYAPELVAHGDYTRAGGAAALHRLVAAAPDLDAVFVGSDLMAAGAMDALTELGRRVPADVAVAGFDDSGLAQTLRPALTTVNQPFAVISTQIVRLLLDIVDGASPVAITVPTTIVVRESA